VSVTNGVRPLLLLLALLLGGCAARGPVLVAELPGTAAGGVELEATPFFPQREYQCGPAALATVLVASGVATDADALVPQVYLPGRQGSLQDELVAASRRHDRLAYRIDGELAAIDDALRAGHPVLVLLNLGIDLLPVWHYAVVVGLDVAADRVILRSGTERRRALAASRFAAAWQRAGRWGVIIARPQAPPAQARPERWLAAAAGLESAGRLMAAAAAYRASLARWPDHARALFGLGNVRYREGQPAAAATLYRRYLARQADDAAAWNNLAMAQIDAGDLAAARASLARAAELRSPPEIAAAIASTRAALAQAAAD
jgi:tetratricopeptide (TPR) repeat protein